ncbi:hypothetical protein [Streptomyces sp. NBC_00268]|uniref:hypothetical protein n=1 Tax=Streptomyces sp. NBC_00268 TaxID=2975695 RepID=UPI00224D19D8|nr:hypothetical protein [Streptomyces sp. NBC_00268]MCX5182640.1 hypothetical protein [Streptomyces sp. NBC_00268]
MLNRPDAAHAELQDLSDHLEVKAARRKWNPALHPRDSKGRFIETGGTVRLWGGKLARVVRALPNDRILVQDQTSPNEFNGRRHTTSAKWVSMVARPDGSAPTDNEDKVQAEDEKRYSDPRRGNGVARDDDGDPDTPNDPHDADDRGRPIGADDDPVGPRENDDQDEPADGKLPVHVLALPNRPHGAGARFRDTAAVRQHFLDLAERPGQKPKMAQFLRSVAGDDDHLETSLNGKVVALRDDSTGRWYLTATGTGQRMDAAGDFATPDEALKFARRLDHSTTPAGQNSMGRGGFDFSDPDLDQAAGAWRSAQGENIQAAIKRARQEFDSSRTTPEAPSADGHAPETVTRESLKPGDRIKVTVSGSDIEWPASTRDQAKPGTVTVEGTLAPTFDGDRTKWAPLLDATLTAPDGTVLTSGDSVRITRMPGQVAMSGNTDGHVPEKVRADRVRVGDVVAGGEFGHVVTAVRRYPGGRTFTTRHLGGRRETHQFGADTDDTMNVIPRARRRPEDVQRDTPGRTQQHPNSGDAKRAAAAILKDWAAANELAEKQWPDGAPEQFRALAQHMQNVTDAPTGAEGYQQNADAMRGALAALDELDTDGLAQDLAKSLHRLEENLDANVDRFAADSRAITEKKRQRAAGTDSPKPAAPELATPEANNNSDAPTGETTAPDEPLKYAWDDPEDLVTLTMPSAVANHVSEEGTWPLKDPDTRKALDEAKRGSNGTIKVTAPIEVHHMLLEAAEVLSGNAGDAEPNEIRGYNNYAKRVHEADAEVTRRREERNANAPGPEAPEADATPEGESEPYDPSFQQQSENGRITHYRTPQGVSRDIGGRFGVGEPVTTRQGETYIVISGTDDGTVNVRKEPLYDDAPLGRSETFQADELRTMDGFRPWRPEAAQAAADEGTPAPDAPAPDDPGVTLSPDEVNAPAAAARASKAPSGMEDGEIRDEIVSLMEREMANGGELEGTDRTRLRVLEAEEARRAGRKPKEEPKPKPKAPAEEPGGLFDVGQDEPQPMFADPNNPDDQPDDPTGTPDMFAAAEGRDTSKLRPVQTRAPQDFQVGDRFVDADGRTHTVAEPPIRTPRGRIRVVSEGGREHFLASDNELRVLHPDEEAPEVPEANAPEGNTPDVDAPESDAPSTDAPEGETLADDAPETEAPEAETPAPDAADVPSNADTPADAEPTAAPDNQVRIDHSGTGTVVRFPTPNGMVSDEEFAVLRRLGFKASRDRTQPRFFYLPSNMTLSRREDKVRQLKAWLDGRNVAYHAPQDDAEKPDLTPEQLEQLKDRYHAPAGTWATTDFQPGDEVWTGRSWETVDSIGPKNLRLQGRGSTPYDSVLARRRGGEIRTMFDAPADDGTPRPGADDPKTMRDEQITQELAHLRDATLPEGNDPSARAVRRQVTARIRALNDAQSERNFARRRDEMSRRDQAALARDPARIARLKGEQVQGRDGAPIGIVYPEKKGKWVFVDRDGRTPTRERYPSRAAAITALNKLTDDRNQRAGEGWKHSTWDDVQPGDTIRVPELGRVENSRSRTVTGWSESLEVSEIRRGDMGQVIISGRRGGEDVELEVPRTDATFGTAKPGTVPERERSEAGGGMDWRQMRPDDFGQDEIPAADTNQNEPRPTDEFGTPDLIANGTPDTPQASPDSTQTPDAPQAPQTPDAGASGDETETARTLRDELPKLPELPKLSGLSRQDKDNVRRIRDDYAQIRASLNGILAGDPPTGDAREDLRRVREQFDYVASRLNRDLLPDSDEARAAQRKLYDLGQDLDHALAALSEREPQPLGDGPDGGTLFHPWDLQDGDLVSFQANDRVNSGLAPFYGTFRGASSASNGRTLVSYEGREWNEDRQQWENRGSQHTVVMPQRGLVERFTPEQWNAWRRPERPGDGNAPDTPNTPDASVAPDAPVGQTAPKDVSDEDIEAELAELQAWQNRHVAPSGEGPHIQGNPMLALSPVASRRGELHEEQRIRSNARKDKERREKEKQERAAALARAEIGNRNDDGSYPVTVDGDDAGTVSQLARKWRYTNDNGDTSPDFYPSRAQAVAALVRNRDVRRDNDAEHARRDQARSQTPDGWTFGDRADVAENDIIRIPRMRRDRDDRPYPEGWGQPVRVNRVERRDDGTAVVFYSNLDGSRAGSSPLFLRGSDDTFAWANDRTRPEPTPEWHHELRARMADIGDDIATLRNGSDGIDDKERMARLQTLIRHVEDGNSEDLQGDLRRIVDETAWLEEQYSNPDLPFETRQRKSWATAAHRKAEAALAHPDFQSSGANAPGEGAPETPSTAPGQDDEFAAMRQRYDGDMVPASEIRRGNWVHTVSADPAYNEEMHMVGRVISVTPVLSDGQVRVEVEAHVTLNGKDVVRTESAMVRGTDLVERLPEGNPGREDSSDLERRIEDANAQRFAAKVRVPEGWQAVDGSQIQPRPGDRFRIVLRSRGGLTDREHMNVTVERPAERDGYWRVKGQPLSFRPSDIVAIPDGTDVQHRDDNAPDTDDRASRARDLFGEGMNAVGGDSLPEMQELNDRLGRVDSADDRDAELRDVADRMDDLADQYGLAGPHGELAADRFRRAARIARGEQDDRDERRGDDNGDSQADGGRRVDGESTDGQNDDNRDETTREDTPASGDDDQQDDGESRGQRRDGDLDGGAAGPDGEPGGGGAGTPDAPGDSDDSSGDGPDNSDDEEDGPDADTNDDEEDRRKRRRRRRNRGGGNGGPGGGGPGGPGLPHLSLPDFNVPDATGDGGADGRDGGRSGARHRDVDSLRNAWRTGGGLTPAEDTPERRTLLAELADREGLALSPDGGLAMWPEPQDDGSTVWRFAQARNGTNLPGITLTSDDPEEARALAGRFEEISDRNGDPFDWHQAWGPSSVAAWRDGEGRNLPQALRAVQDDYEQERSGAFTLPDDLTGLDDADLEAAYRQGLGPEDELRVIAEMDRRDGYVDERIRAAVPDTPPADADEAERRGRAMDEALGFGDTDVTQPAPATPGRLRREFDALDEERFQAAMQATGGRLLSPEAEASGVDARDLFSGRKVTAARAKELASQELRDWWKENGGRLTYSTYRQREQDRVLRDEFALIDEARYLAAVDATNGYFFRREYKFGGTNFDERELFSGGSLSSRERWKQYASEELEEWFKANGGRLTFAQFKQQRRDGERRDLDQFEEEQRRAAEAGDETGAGNSAGDGAPDGSTAFTADDVTPAPSASMRGESKEDAAFRFGGHDRMKEFADMAELRPDEIAQGESVWLNGQRIGTIANLNRSNPDRGTVWRARPFFGLDDNRQSRSQSRDTAIANLVVRALQDGPTDSANPSEDVWDSVTLRLASVTRALPELPESLRSDPEARARYERLSSLVDAFRDQHSPSGNLRQDLAQARDDFAWLHDAVSGSKRNSQQHEALSTLDSRTYWAGQFLDALGGPETDLERPRADDEPNGDGDAPSPAVPTPEEPVNTPEDTARPPAEPEPEPAPDPIGGQPAHWARVEDLTPGDMVRMTGTTKKGRPVQRAGYVYTPPVRVEVTRRGRTEHMWRTWVTENPDGTGAAGNVYTSSNATAARAEAPDDVVPGSPASGAQAALRSGDLPDQIPADRSGRGLFPGSTVTGANDREGTITGANDTTVSVHWSDGNDDTALSPTALTVTDSQRPDGWTASGQRVTPQHVVSDTDGALLGPVDDVDGDNVTITTADGTVTRSAGDLRVTGEVRDDIPGTAPVTGIDEPAAADLKDGDVVVLDLDGTLSTVAITSPPSRDGDRVTLQYADTTTGEMGEIDVDARAVLPRAHGADGGAPDLGPDNAPEPDEDLVVHEPPHRAEPVTGPTVDPELDSSDRNVIGDHADGPEDDPDAHQAAVRITADLPVTPEQASALAAQLRAAADPSTPEGRAALRAADRLDRADGRTPPPGLDRPRPTNVGQLTDGDLVALPGDRSSDPAQVYRVVDVIDAPGGIRSLQLEDSDGRRTHRVEHGALPVWRLPEAEPEPVIPPDVDDTDPAPDAPSTPSAPSVPSTPDEPSAPIARVRPGSLRNGDVIDAPVSRTGYQFNGHRRLTIIGDPQRNGWWMQLTGVDDDGNVHDFGLHNGRSVNVYERNRPTPALPPVGAPRDPNPSPQSAADRIIADHHRAVAARIIDEAITGTEPPGDIHALREGIAQRLTPEALRDARQAARQDALDALDAAGVTGDDRKAARQALRQARQDAHTATVRAALRTINDLEPLPDESDEDLAARARDLLRLIPDGIAGQHGQPDADADGDITRTVAGHADDAVNALLQQLQAAGVDPGDAERIARTLTRQLDGSRQATARRIARRVAAVSPDAGRQPGLLARVVALLIRMAKRLAELVKAGARKIAEKYRDTKERLARLRAFLGRLVRRVRHWPESRRLARLHRAVNLPDADGESLAARISHWAGLMPEPGRFGQAQRRVTFWRPTTWGQLAAGRLPDRSDRIQWSPDRAADGGPGLTALRHMAALRAAGTDVDQDVTRRLSAALGDDFGDDPHATLQHADDYVATSERRLVNLQAARSGATIPDDPDLEIEITAARAELSAARREYGDLRTRYAAAVPDAVAAALADIRDMGPEGNTAIVFGPDTNPDAERAVRGVQRLIPRAWLNTPEVRRLTAVDGTQGRYEPEGQRITVADLSDEGMGTAGHALAQHLAEHLGDLDAAQRAFWFTRTHTGRPGARRMQRSALSRLLRRWQQTQPETGDSLARSIQAMFSGDWYQDDDLRAFLLGLMATR